MRTTRGERLYALVEQYTAFGDHHTGTTVDDVTRDWFAAELERRGARVGMVDYEFDRYVADARVTVGGQEIRCAPLFYSGVGAVKTSEPFVAGVAADGGASARSSAETDDLLGTARAQGRLAAVVATGPPDGRLVASNRRVVDPPGPIAVLVPGAVRAALDDGDVLVTAEARVTRGASATVVARLGPGNREPALLVTTPLTGWFGCAGERGTGIAVALELAHELAHDMPLAVVATTGHELGFLGLHDHLARTPVTAASVIHLGASVAAGDGRELSPFRACLVDGVAPSLVEQLGAALAPARLPVTPWDPAIPADAGEGAVWRGRGAAVLSILGWFDRFHTPDDVPDAVTSPRLLEAAFGAVVAAARAVATE